MPVIRKLLKRKPEAAALLMQDMTKAGAFAVLLQAKKELADLLAVSQAMSAAAADIAKLDKQDLVSTQD